MSNCKHCERQADNREFRGLLAVLVTILTFGLAYVQAIKGGSETLLPPWAGVVLGSVYTFYFMARTGERMREISQEQKKPQSGSPID
jgi:hypothetical protein